MASNKIEVEVIVKEKKAKTTHIICILDCSTSMGGQEEHVISNFNKFLKEQQELPGKAKLTLVKFDSEYEVIYDQVNLQRVKKLTHRQYFTRGMTAMYDAIGSTIDRLKSKKRAIVLIHTDGDENYSSEYTQRDVQKLVKSKKKDWEFIFAGAGIDAKRYARDYGMNVNNSFKVSNNVAGLADSYSNFTCSTTAYRAGNKVDLNEGIDTLKDIVVNNPDIVGDNIIKSSSGTVTINTVDNSEVTSN